MPLPPEEENGENAANEEPKLQFSYVECLLFSFHQLGKKLPDFLIDKISAEKLKDFKIRSDLTLIIRKMVDVLLLKTFEILKHLHHYYDYDMKKNSLVPILSFLILNTNFNTKAKTILYIYTLLRKEINTSVQ